MKRRLCTVLIPFDSPGEGRFALLKQLGEKLDFDTFRVAQYYSSGMILEEIVRSIRDAHLVIADLTGCNPNVYYEVGIAHALGKRVFLTAEDPDAARIDFEDFHICKLEMTHTGRDRLLQELRDFRDTPGILSPIDLYTGGLAVAGQPLMTRRIGSFLIDLPILFLPTLLFNSSEWLVTALSVAGFVAYFFLTTTLIGGSVGQKLLGLKVIRLDRSKPYAWQSLLRPVISLLSLAFLGIGFLWAVKPPRYQAVQDRITRTIIVKRRSLDPTCT
jgi:uncharacterized RDD family membrane protein YckC